MQTGHKNCRMNGTDLMATFHGDPSAKTPLPVPRGDAQAGGSAVLEHLTCPRFSCKKWPKYMCLLAPLLSPRLQRCSNC